MPTRAPRLCAEPGCSRTTTRGRCPQHEQRHAARVAARRAESDARRPSARARGYGTDWEALRPRILARDPICTACHVKPSKHVDHIVPRSLGGTDDPSNLRGLCPPCHSAKTAQHDGGFGNRVHRGGQLRAAHARAPR